MSKNSELSHHFSFFFLSRCLIPEGTTPQNEAAGGVILNTIEAESIRDEEAAPGQVAVTGHGGIDGKTATMFIPGGEASYPWSLTHLFNKDLLVTC